MNQEDWFALLHNTLRDIFTLRLKIECCRGEVPEADWEYMQPAGRDLIGWYIFKCPQCGKEIHLMPFIADGRFSAKMEGDRE
jgi:hypothetical protein